MYDQPVRDVMVAAHLLATAPQTTVRRAAHLMTGSHAGCVLVVDGERLVGIFTAQDMVSRVVAGNLDPDVTPVEQVMTAAPVSIAPQRPFGLALALMHKHGVNHLPVVQDDKVLGLVSVRNALDPDMEDFVAEERRRTQYELAALP